MIPIVARLRGSGDVVLIVAFVGSPAVPGAVFVREGGKLGSCAVTDLIVERPTPAFPMGYSFSRAQTKLEAELVT